MTIRTFDAGGDKPVAGLYRGRRGQSVPRRPRPAALPGAARDFRVQLRALARAAVRGNLKVMFPMVTIAGRIRGGTRTCSRTIVQRLQARRHCRDASRARHHGRGAGGGPDDRRSFEAAFFSIGSNDLAQYVTACDRTNGALATLIDPLHPAVLELIARTAEHGRRAGISVSLCGDMAGDPRCIPALLRCGLRELSVSPSALAQIKQTIDRLSSGGGLD